MSVKEDSIIDTAKKIGIVENDLKKLKAIKRRQVIYEGVITFFSAIMGFLSGLIGHTIIHTVGLDSLGYPYALLMAESSTASFRQRCRRRTAVIVLLVVPLFAILGYITAVMASTGSINTGGPSTSIRYGVYNKNWK